MKKLTIYLGVYLFSTLVIYAQQFSTNIEGSKYQFSKVVSYEATPVQSQGMTGTCWSFSALSFLESELMRKGQKNVQPLSEMYIVRKAYEMKAEKYLRMDGKVNFSEGGAFHDIPLVIKKYGIVPYSVYDGLNGSKSYNHSELFKELDNEMKLVLSKIGAEEGVNADYKKRISVILDKYLGPEPNSFTLDKSGQKTDPKSYANQLGLKMEDYVSITSFSNHEFNKPCMLEIPDNWAWGESYNVPLEDLVSVTIDALNKGYTLAWGADVSEKGFSFKNGIAVVPENSATIDVIGKDNRNFNDAGADRMGNAFLSPVKEMKITQEVRQNGYDNKTTTDDHGMHIVGLYTDQNGTRYFLVKNSWGTGNYPKGYLYVSENYFKFKTINVYLHKDALSAEIKTNLGLK
ncbi:MAG: C1 family peptidase [Crocinitomicaceae bacterium]